MKKYNDSVVRQAIDDLQKELLFALNNSPDWFAIPPFKANNSVPSSCCWANATSLDTCGRNPPQSINTGGCVKSIEAWLRKHIVIVAAVALGIAFFEVPSAAEGSLGGLRAG
nr:CD63 antigen-like [Pelodiscus sinensis]|eukprot:XP_014433039.1 CD63 antigen-like [Pelodiscus sinensis]